MNSLARRLRFLLACCLFASLISFLNLGCDEALERRAIPAPLRYPVEQTYTGRIVKPWGGDNFEFLSNKETHYLLLRGVDAPDPGQPFYHQSMRMTKRLTNRKQVTVHVAARDEVMREIVDVTVPVGKTKGDFEADEFDLGVELIKRGWALYNGTPFEGAQQLIEAERHAKKLKIGIWVGPKNVNHDK